MNDMTVAGQGGAVATADDYDPYAAYGRESSNNIVGKLMRFSKGDWLIGDDEVPVGTQMIANMDNLLIGWILWEDKKPEETIMGLLKEGHRPQKRETLGHDDESVWPTDKDGKAQDPWQETNYLPLKDPKDGELYTFSTSSTGGRGAISKLCKDYGTKRRMHPNQFPIVALNVDSYKHKDTTLGRIKVPEFKIVGWVAASAFEGDVPAEEPKDKVQEDLLTKVGTGTTKF
jgi:hypothetical protein